MKNKELLIKGLEKIGYGLGCYDLDMEKLSKKELQNVIDQVKFYDTCNVCVKIRKKDYVVECHGVDNEIDFTLTSLENYINQYGENPLED